MVFLPAKLADELLGKNVGAFGMKGYDHRTGFHHRLFRTAPDVFGVQIDERVTIVFIGSLVLEPVGIHFRERVARFKRKELHPRELVDKFEMKVFAEDRPVDIEDREFVFFR